MVNKNQLKYLHGKIGRSIHPYDSVSPLTTEEALGQYSAWIEGEEGFEGFKDAERIVYHRGSKPEEDDIRFGLLEAVALDMKVLGEDPEIYLNNSLEDMVEASEVLEEEDVIYQEADSLEEEIKNSFRTSVGGKSIHITADYEAGTVKRFREDFDSLHDTLDKSYRNFEESEFLVLSADTSELENVPTSWNHFREARRKPDWD